MTTLRLQRSKLSAGNTRKLSVAPKQADPHYLTPEHKAWRIGVLRRAGFACQRCGTKGVKFYADHIKELKDGGHPTDPANGSCLCAPCHGQKTARERGRRAITVELPS